VSPVHRNQGEISGIGRAVTLLREFRSGSGVLTAAALETRTGLPKTTVHRMLGELVRVGLLERTGHSYQPGLLLFELGQVAPRQRGLREAALPYLGAMHTATGHNVGLAVLEGREVVYVEILRGKDDPRLPQRVGGRWPAHASCSGKVILAYSGPEALAAVTGGRLRRLTENTITDPDALADELRRVRRRGAAYDRQESFSSVAGVASPVTGPDGEVVGALSISGLTGRISLTRMESAVRTAALAVSDELGRARSIVPPVLRPSAHSLSGPA
jgi:IclR family transcriptional regulator, acetate operon repressor